MPPFNPNPLKELLLDEGASLVPYGIELPEPGAIQRQDTVPENTPLLAAAFGPIELEYASLRTDCVIIDRPDRAVVEVTGTDAREFLGRMLTADVARLEPNQSCNSFWLNRKGRIDADLRVARGIDARPGHRWSGQWFLLDMEVGSAACTIESLSAFIITEDVVLRLCTPLNSSTPIERTKDVRGADWTHHRLSLHGPRAKELLRAAVDVDWMNNLERLKPGSNTYVELVSDGLGVTIDRNDTAAVPGYELLVPSDYADELYRGLLRAGRPDFMSRSTEYASSDERGAAIASAHSETGTPMWEGGPPLPLPASIRLRPCGWFAYNIARIEAGTPLFKIDFGPDNLPAETGVLEDRVNFKKGCYLGQEIVARMHARGHPKQRLVALRFDDDLPPGPDGLPPLPVQGDRVLPAAEGGQADPKPIGSITSSTFSPMLGRVPVAFAMVSWAHVTPGTRVLVETDGTRIGATVQERLRFVP